MSGNQCKCSVMKLRYARSDEGGQSGGFLKTTFLCFRVYYNLGCRAWMLWDCMLLSPSSAVFRFPFE